MTEQQQIEAQEEAQAEGWRPEPGARIVGTVIDIAANDMGYGPYAIVTLETASGPIAVHAFHTVLRRELAKRRPKVGDQLDITYLGKKGEGGHFGKGYDNYRVKSDKDAAGYDWNRDLPGGADDDPADVPIEPTPVPTVAETEKARDEQFGATPPF